MLCFVTIQNKVSVQKDFHFAVNEEDSNNNGHLRVILHSAV